jgi:hypothetical protein
MVFNRICFFTATIHKWITLFEMDAFRQILISSLNFLNKKELLEFTDL